MQPVNLCDELTLQRTGNGIQLTCNEAALPTDSSNLVVRAAAAFFTVAGLPANVRIHLEKRIPMAAGLGGGSGNAAATLLGLNDLFEGALSPRQLPEIAASLGSDVPFFLQSMPALATGRGERVEPLATFRALDGCGLLLVQPGFGIATAWAYKELGRFPASLKGQAGRAKKLISLLDAGDIRNAGREFYNSLEAPALEKYPWLAVLQDFLRENGALATLMSGSGSTTFAITRDLCGAQELEERVKDKMGRCWTAAIPMGQ
jgi:4-diphosphocytidyl-2-C-methyl-D-erythritol kinase